MDNDGDADGYADAACGGDDCDDGDASVVPEPGGGCALGASCAELVAAGFTDDDVYPIDPDGFAVGVAPFDVWCDQTTDGGGWTLVWKHAYEEVGTPTDDMRFYSATLTECLSEGDSGDWCNVPAKASLAPTEMRILATHDGTAVYDFVGDFNADVDVDWSGGILDNWVVLLDLCATASTGWRPEPEQGAHAMLGLTWDKANNFDYTSNCDTDRYGGGSDCRWENCGLPTDISASPNHVQMTLHMFVR